MTDAPVTDPTAYEPPKVWTWNKESGGRFASINRPIGPTHQANCRSAAIHSALFAGDAQRRQGRRHVRGALAAGFGGV
jgi:hypothetical protein